jgi:transcriptional regulator with XRE-family HTH domain
MVTPYILQQLNSGIVRLRVTPDEPAEGPPAIAQRPGSRGPHTDMTVAKVRHLIEHTALSYREIAAKTGVSRYSIYCWTRDGKWVRPLDAPRASDLVPTHRASRRLKLRKLADRLQTLAERYVNELEQTRGVDLDRLTQALQVLRMARLEVMGNRGRRRPWIGPAVGGAWKAERDNAIRTALKEMRRGGVDLDRAPKEALDLVIEANTPVEDFPELRPRGRPRRK